MTLLAYPPGMLACLREGSRGGCNPPPADQPRLFEVATDDPRRFIEPPSRLAVRPSRRDAKRP